MTITAKYPGRCVVCGGAIKPGDRVEWTAERGKLRHEACAAAAKPEVNRPKAYAPTGEQQNALRMFATGGNLAIEAGAGTGKTSALILLAQSTTRRGQYVAFNKSIVTDASAMMPGTVNCSTAHSLAFRAVGHQYRDRLDNARRMRSIAIARHLGIESMEVGLEDGTSKTLSAQFMGGLVMAAITRFCQSGDLALCYEHIPEVPRLNDGSTKDMRRWLLPFANAAWKDLMSPNGILPFRHDHYLKAWHLSGPRIGADYILFDECQDANPVMLAIIEAQTHAQLVFVGDSQQAIYGFTGAINALQRIREKGAETAFLTQSFRFGPAVADVANRVLAEIPEASLRLVGTTDMASVVGPVAMPRAILTRTNAVAVRTVMRLQAEGRVAALVGGGEEVVTFAKAAALLMENLPSEHPDLACFSNWNEVRAYVSEDEQGGELRLLVTLVDDFTVPAILHALDRVIPEESADVTVSTAHKSKGRQWPAVRIAEDFPTYDKMTLDELRLLYVAVTRARLELDIDAVDFFKPRKPAAPKGGTR